ncbi:hypothetical protein DHX103_10780 [Planococcus sp. X10-3]|uniref:hypothetical protein n=1 Tax=Planococcus sp. X10-3 TaxID=3061240 RepID=UPI003BAF3EA6
MKVGTALFLVFVALLLTIYFYIVEPLSGASRWAAYGVYLVLFVGLIVAIHKLENRFELLRRKLSMGMSVLFVVCLLSLLFVLSMII